MRETVIVGGGPVGLWTAAQILRRSPRCIVTIYERHETYKRSHVLQLDHWSLLLYGRLKNADERLHQFYEEVTGKSLSGVAMTPAKSVFVRTNDLEAALRKYATDLGARIVIKTIESLDEVEALHPECLHFIAADGARSRMRKQLLGEVDTEEKPLRHIVELKYQVKGSAAKFKALSASLKVNRNLNAMAFEYVGKEKNGLVPVTLRFFVDEKTHKGIPEATFANPLQADDTRIPEVLRKDIAKYLAARNKASGEVACAESAKVTKLILSVYAAKQFVVQRGDKAWFLTGDAALGVPYFRALNSGLMLSSRLAQLLCAKTWPLNSRIDRQALLYRIHRPLHIQTEFSIAHGKNFALDLFEAAKSIGSTDSETTALEWAPDCGQTR